MPKCIDDPSRSYKGTEPSPKGLGYCAHTQSVGTSKTGNDGNIWIVKTTYKGTKRWVKNSNSNKKTPVKRKAPKRVSKKKTSGKRKSTRKVSKKKKSPLVVNKNMTRKEFLRWMKQIDTRPKTYEKTENGTYPITWNIGSDLKENEIYTTDLGIFFHGNNGQSVTSSYTKPSYTLKKSEIRKIVRNIVKEEQKNRNIKKINEVATHFKPFLYRGKPEKGAMIAEISIYHS